MVTGVGGGREGVGSHRQCKVEYKTISSKVIDLKITTTTANDF
jgi:hypothetical protein